MSRVTKRPKTTVFTSVNKPPYCGNADYGQILKLYLASHADGRNDSELKRIHVKWKRLAAEC